MTTKTFNALSYRILLREEPEGGYTVTVPTLPGCITYGETITEAIAMAREAIELYLESLVDKAMITPPPRPATHPNSGCCG